MRSIVAIYSATRFAPIAHLTQRDHCREALKGQKMAKVYDSGFSYGPKQSNGGPIVIQVEPPLGARVEFEVSSGRDGRTAATNVVLIEDN
jgi:hypothetical protein